MSGGCRRLELATHSYVLSCDATMRAHCVGQSELFRPVVGGQTMRMRRRGITAGLAVAVVVLGSLSVAPAASAATPTDVFISEYIEGTSNNKALEIYNGTGASVDLAAGGYQVEMYFNGSASAGLTIPLTGTVTDGD